MTAGGIHLKYAIRLERWELFNDYGELFCTYPDEQPEDIWPMGFWVFMMNALYRVGVSPYAFPRYLMGWSSS